MEGFWQLSRCHALIHEYQESGVIYKLHVGDRERFSHINEQG
jgi:hypothetical protein